MCFLYVFWRHLCISSCFFVPILSRKLAHLSTIYLLVFISMSFFSMLQFFFPYPLSIISSTDPLYNFIDTSFLTEMQYDSSPFFRGMTAPSDVIFVSCQTEWRLFAFNSVI
uniref:Uncharacterized protein n=1 Tax=Cacopsylla melanoneura TaxID=428564 RepID=A0A8D9BMV1_9HEMI